MSRDPEDSEPVNPPRHRPARSLGQARARRFRAGILDIPAQSGRLGGEQEILEK